MHNSQLSIKKRSGKEAKVMVHTVITETLTMGVGGVYPREEGR